jgi:Fic-DOC domain mobile mystery protein B
VEQLVSEWEALAGETPTDVSHLKLKWVKTRSQLDIVEARNIRKAVLKYFGRRRPTRRMAPFDLGWIKRLHKEMFGDVWEWAGEIRTRDLNLGVRWNLIDEALHNLMSDLEIWQHSEMDVVEQAVRLHHRAVQIHPFYNGNGRWARMLANVLLRCRGHRETLWPEELLGSQSAVRRRYLAAIQEADLGNYDPLLLLTRDCTATSDPDRSRGLLE